MSNNQTYASYRQINRKKISTQNTILINYSNKGLMKYLNQSRNNAIGIKKTKTTNNSINLKIRKIKTKEFELKGKKKEEKNKNESLEKNDTSKIDYRHYKNYPIDDIIPIKQEKSKLYWLVTYDKLIKLKNIIKILNISNHNDINGCNSLSIYSETSIKTKTMKITNFELFYVEGYDKPFVKPNKNNKSFIFARLYLLTLKEINKIINFINRTEDKINIENYISFAIKNSFSYIDFENNSNIINIDINYPYCYIYYLGQYMNISMILFTNTFNYIKDNKSNSNIDNDKKSLNIIYSLPNSKKLYKLIKLIIKYFPDNNPEYIVEHIINSDLYSNSKIKKNEVLKNLSLLKSSLPNKLLLNKVLRETIKGIQTNSSHSISNPFDSGDQIKISDIMNNNSKQLLKPKLSSYKTLKVIPIGFKNSINSNLLLNVQYGSNYLSTNYSMLPNNSIKTYNCKNSTNNVPLINFPFDNNNNNKNSIKENVENNKKIKEGKIITKKKFYMKKKSYNNLKRNRGNYRGKAIKPSKQVTT